MMNTYRLYDYLTLSMEFLILVAFRLDDSLSLQNAGLSDVCLATLATEGQKTTIVTCLYNMLSFRICMRHSCYDYQYFEYI